MAARSMEIVVAVVLGAILAAALPLETVAQSSCHNEIASLSPCYGYIDGSSSNPSSLCCNRLENVVQTQPACLCEVLNGEGLNKTRVLALPSACNVQTPSASYCYSPPPSSGYSAKILNSLLLSVLTAASCAGIFIII
ncbi:hypothetical protein Pfo_017551 [Paulownia fortunei]|nr:hypothetical protein Pfo_017551 [Paulownia fortunei]